MALPQHELYDPDGKHIGTFERRADAEHEIERQVQALAAKFTIDDSKWREQEALEFEAAAERARIAEAEKVLTAQAEKDKAVKEAQAVVKAAKEAA